MKSIVLAVLALATCAAAFTIEVEELKKLGYKLQHSDFGDVVMSKVDGLNT
jgi:hypothetical protein